MNITNVKKVLPLLMKNNIVPLLWGSAGVGKTDVVGQVAKELGIGFIPLYLAENSDVGDLIGLLDKDQNNRFFHLMPDWFPTEGKGIIFLDELNRAHPDILQVMLPFVLTRKLGRYQLPEGWNIVCANNYNSNDFKTTDMSDAALLSRFCHIDFTPSEDEFISYAEDMKADTIAGFIREHKSMLEIKPKDKDFDSSMMKPTRRSWLKFINPLEREDLGDNRYEVYCGLVGMAAASSFFAYKAKSENSLDINKILKNYKSVRDTVLKSAGNKKEVRLDLLNQPIEELLSRLESNPEFLKEEWVDNLKAYLFDIPAELGMKVFKRMGELNFKNKDSIINDVEFCKRIKNKKAS